MANLSGYGSANLFISNKKLPGKYLSVL